MRTASTDERTWEIIEQLHGSNCKAQCMLEYYNDGWVYLEDLDTESGLSWDESSQIDKTGNFPLLPKSASLSFNVININGKYSDGSGTEYENVLDLGTRLRLKGGYKLNSVGETITETIDINSNINTLKYYMSDSSNNVVLDSGGDNDITYFNDLFATFYDTETYGDSNYTPAAAFIQTIDNIKDGFKLSKSFKITNNSTNGTIYYRVFSNLNTVSTLERATSYWTNAGSTINGSVTVDVNSDKRYLQVAVVYDGIDWSGGDQITSLTVDTASYVEWVYTTCFLMDTPSFSDPREGLLPMISCKARDVWKRVLDTDYNTEDISAGVTADTFIKKILTVAGVSYTSTSIADLSSFGNLSYNFNETKKCYEILEYVMQWITRSSEKNYRMYIKYDETTDDNICYVEEKPDAYEAVFVQNYRYYEKIGSRKKTYDKLLQRVTVVDDDLSHDEEILLNGVQNVTSSGEYKYTWTNEAGYKRVVYDSTGSSSDFAITIKEINTGVTDPVDGPNVVFTITGTTINVDISVYGCEWSASDPSVEAEYINLANMTDKKGVTITIENPYFKSGTDADVKDIAEGFGADYGNPSVEIGNLVYPYLNLIDDLNDPVLIWSRLFFNDDIFAVTAKSYRWSENPNDGTNYKLIDTGINFSDLGTIIYDSGTELIKYDNGFVYDMNFGPQATEAEIDAGTIHTYDVG